MRKLILFFFAWWHRQTFGTKIYTLRKGIRVGSDALGNIYYRDRTDRRRWVIYAEEAEASTVPPNWHGWLHHTFPEPPASDNLAHLWQKPGKANLTGTPLRYRPKGSLLNPAPQSHGKKPFEPWRPS